MACSKEPRALGEKRGIPGEGIVTSDNLARLAPLEREREERFAVIDRMREAFKHVPPEEIEREADRSTSEARERLQSASHSASRTDPVRSVVHPPVSS